MRSKIRRCAECGCTDNRACLGGCWWTYRSADGAVSICSSCDDDDVRRRHGAPIRPGPTRPAADRDTDSDCDIMDRATTDAEQRAMRRIHRSG
jgi:hypothetical protein